MDAVVNRPAVYEHIGVDPMHADQMLTQYLYRYLLVAVLRLIQRDRADIRYSLSAPRTCPILRSR